MNEKKAIITDDKYDMTVDNGTNRYYCPKCEANDIYRGDNYCCNCGIKIEWGIAIRDLENKED